MRQLVVAAVALALVACSSAAAPSRAPASGLAKVRGLGDVRLLAPVERGGGAVPTFRWSPVAGASRYRLALLDAQSHPVWAWEGEATTVRLGGLSVNRPEGSPGPVVTAGSHWMVAALGADGHVVAVSALRPVSP